MASTPNPMDRVVAMERQVMLLVKVTNEQSVKIKKLEQTIASMKKQVTGLEDSHRMQVKKNADK